MAPTAMAMSQSEINSLLSTITVRLSENNFVKWSFQFQAVLEGNDLFGYFDGSYPCPPRFVLTEEGQVTSEITMAYKLWKKTDKALLGLLMATLDGDIMDIIVGSKSSHEAWLALLERFSTVSRANIIQLKTDLQTIKKGADTIDKYLQRIKHARDQLSSVGVTLVDEDIVVVTLNGLPDEYAMIKTVIRARDTPISLKDFRAQLLVAERDIESQLVPHTSMSAMAAKSSSYRGNNSSQFSGSSSTYNVDKGKAVWNDNSKSETWNGNGKYSQSKNSSGGGFRNYNGVECQVCGKKGHMASNCYQNMECHICHKKGHIASKCFQNPANNNQGVEYRNNIGASPECQICSKKGHTAINCFYRGDIPLDHPSRSVVVCQICGLKGRVALNCHHRSNYAYQGSDPPNSLTAMTARTNCSGASSSSSSNSNNTEVWIGDTGATHHMTSDLRNLSIAHPFDSNNTITIGNGEGLHDKASKALLYRGKSNGEGLFLFKTPKSIPPFHHDHTAFVGAAVKCSLWHQRLGHPSSDIVSRMLSLSQVKFNNDQTSHTCSHCLSGKMHRLPFSESISKSVLPFQKVHSDLWGPAPCLSIEGFKYYVTFIDDYTKFVWVYPLINKSDTFSTFVKFHNFVSTQFRHNILSLQTDGGGEYNSKAFRNYLDHKGIVHFITCPHTPQQNGVAERKNRHIVETCITLMSAAKMPKPFWFHAVAHSAYLINRMPCKSLNMSSPYIQFFGSAPDLSHLKIFGSACYPFLRPYCHDKLDPRTTKCVFLGYALGYKGVFCYSIEKNKLWMCRHVIHDESIFPFQSSGSDNSSKPTHVSSSASASSPHFFPPMMPALSSDQMQAVLPFVNTLPPAASLPALADGGADGSVAHADFVPHDHDDHENSENSENVENNVGEASGNDSDTSFGGVSPEGQVLSQELQFLDDPALAYNNHSMLTRAKNGIFKKKSFDEFCAYSCVVQNNLLDELSCFSGLTAVIDIHDPVEPKSFKAAVGVPEWDIAMNEEIDALKKQATWELVPFPEGKNIVGSKWVYRIKKNPDGSVSRFKARLVAQGYSQEKGLDYDETFSPVVRHSTVRIILSLAAMNNWELRQLDVKNAFLHGDLKEEVYMHQPLGFVDSVHPNYVCLLRKYLYGLKQAPRAWNEKFTNFLPALGFKFSHSDPSLFVKATSDGIIALLLYVDDIVITGSDKNGVSSVISELSDVFDMKDLGPLSYFLGINVQYKDKGLFLSQETYAKDLIAKAGLDTCRECNTPCLPHAQLLKNEGTPLSNPSLYRSIVGALQYLTFTRPDIAFAVNTVCQFMSQPTDVHYASVKRILRYISSRYHIKRTVL
ncbi:putative RNA-directed DNA polymerase [Rosa chinensis]|uniref:Putative RNA-directed DNA polymerase n=1 Tax=Rosa chinensis TaxID=74649 RepID=A0A2P6RXR5_ROSCH|nr:putative RNA-directed DNA polymerase [Rosa chinensis]